MKITKRLGLVFSFLIGVLFLVFLSSCAERKKFTITWVDYNGNILSIDSNVEIGKTPAYFGTTPKRESTEDVTYSFSGWTPYVVPATKNQTYTATYKSSPRCYNVVWLNYDDTVLETDTNVPFGTMPTYDGKTPTKPGDETHSYVFKSWTPGLVPVSKDTTYKATYTDGIGTYTARFLNYDGELLYEADVIYGQTPVYGGSTPKREDDGDYSYTFSDWDKDLGPIYQDTTYSAKYYATPILHQINFDFNGGTSVYPSTKSVYILSETDFPMDVRQEGYNFRGWTYNDEIVVDQNGNFVKSITLVDNMTFMAAFSETSTLTLTTKIVNSNKDYNPGSVTGAAKYSYHEEVTITAKANEGFVFIGWYSVGEQGSNGILISNQLSYTFQMWEKDTTIEARYQVDSYTLDIKSENPDYGLVSVVGEAYAENDTIDVVYGEAVRISAVSYTEDVTFLGWYNDEKLVSSNTVYTFNMPNEDLSLRAVWDRYTITFDGNGGGVTVNFYSKDLFYHSETLTNGDSLTYPEIPTKGSSLFKCWTDEDGNPFVDEMITEGIDLYASWYDLEDDLNEIYDYVDANYSATIIDEDSHYFIVPYSGYVSIKYWNSSNATTSVYKLMLGIEGEEDSTTYTCSSTDEEETDSIYVSAGSRIYVNLSMAEENTTTKAYYTFIYEPSIAKLNDAIIVSYGNFYTVPYLPSRATATFTGWYDEDGELAFDPSGGMKVMNVHRNITYTAGWEFYTLTTMMNYPTAGPITAYNEDPITAGKEITIDAANADGFIFLGWYEGDTLLTEEASYTFEMPEKNVIYTAIYSAYTITVARNDSAAGDIYVTVTFDLNNGAGTHQVQEVSLDTAITYPSVPSYTKHIFRGWYTDQECTTLFDFTENLQEDITLYAGWADAYTENVNTDQIVNAVECNSEATASVCPLAATSDTNYFYSYFICYTDGTYTIYYKNNTNDEINQSYVYMYNMTTNITILLNTLISSSDYTNVSFTAEAGDVICIRAYRKNDTASPSISYYVTGAAYPTAGGMMTSVRMYKPGETVTLSAKTNEGYTFLGWYNGTTLVSTNLICNVTMQKESVTYTAKWTTA